MEEAYDAFYKATWNYGWRSAAHLALSEIGASRGDFATALDHVRLCLRTNADHTIARNLGVMLLRKLGREHEAEEWLSETLALDPLDYWAIFLAGRPLGDNQALLDVTFDLIRAGFFADAKMLLEERGYTRWMALFRWCTTRSATSPREAAMPWQQRLTIAQLRKRGPTTVFQVASTS
jgi:tetratricopeptide (TPR) repeat protein